MNEAQLIRLVKGIVRESLAPILMGTVVSTKDAYRATAQRFKTENPIENMRLLHPYGLAARPPSDMQALIVPVDGRPDHLNVLGQFDDNRPEIEDGEVCLYGPDGQVVYMKTGGNVLLGGLEADNPAVLGDILSTFLGDIITNINTINSQLSTFALAFSAPFSTNAVPGSPVGPGPALVSAITALQLALTTAQTQLTTQKTQFLDVPATNIVSGTIFLER